MKIDDIKDFEKQINGNIEFNYDIKKLNWFNIGGKSRIFFKPETLRELIDFLKLYKKRGKIFILGAGSNILFNDEIFNGVVIKLGKIFSNFSLINKNTIVAGSAALDKKLSEYAKENSISGFEFLSGIPGTIGGGIRMNSGCFNSEFKDILISVQAVDQFGKIITIPNKNIDFYYRDTNLSKELIFLSATFKGKTKEKKLISDQIEKIKFEKEKSQPSRIKTSGSTFKNPKTQTNKKAWELIKESIPLDTKYGDAEISNKHCNFFVNKKDASFKDMKKLINFVKDKVKSKTGIKIDLEIVIVE